MVRFLFLATLFLSATSTVSARHIKGGWVQVEYLNAGTNAGTSVYRVTVYVFRNCAETGPMPTSLNVYDAVTYNRVLSLSTSTSSYVLQGSPTKTSFDPCLSNPPTICYMIYTFTTTITVTDNPNGYLVVASDANRIAGIVNIANPTSTGISFVGNILGTVNGVDYHINSSPSFEFKDTAIVCYNAPFQYQFAAKDADGDSLSYDFGNGVNGTQAATAPPYSPLTYTSGFSGQAPLGGQATINTQSGLISGIAPSQNGEYVIAVYVSEWRNGVKINSTRKELQIIVGDCSLSAAKLNPTYINCNSFDFSFQNESLASNITNYFWDFGDPSITTDVSTLANPTYTYKDTGTYQLVLRVGNAGGCKDSAKAFVKVYPGFTPAFGLVGSCYQNPFQFTDKSIAKYGVINSWSWDFGESGSTDTSSVKNPIYRYGQSGNYIASLTVNSSVGCVGTVTQPVAVNDKPYLFLPFKDTLICSIDSLKLTAQTSAAATFKWSPNYRITDITQLNPVVFPKDTTVYTLTVADNGCIDSAKIQVNVLQFITVKLGLDTGICKTDGIVLKPISDALSYKWRESTGANSLSDSLTKYPVARPLVDTKYFVTANLGYCQDSTNMTVHVSPYPVAQVINDTAICYGTRVQLLANYTGASYQWSNTASLLNAQSLSPVAGPSKTTSYVFTVSDTLYCPKKVSDTVTVRVVQPIHLSAGKDTSISLGQPLQLLATGADASYTYRWSPDAYLDNPQLANPVATITSATSNPFRYVLKATSPEGCTSSDDIAVKIYEGGPDILVPSGFTPNADGHNDMLKPLLIGISKLDYFQVFNRWGQLIFSTSQINAGWDGTFNGVNQPSGAYVYSTQGADWQGKTVYRKGTVVLIR